MGHRWTCGAGVCVCFSLLCAVLFCVVSVRVCLFLSSRLFVSVVSLVGLFVCFFCVSASCLCLIAWLVSLVRVFGCSFVNTFIVSSLFAFVCAPRQHVGYTDPICVNSCCCHL